MSASSRPGGYSVGPRVQARATKELRRRRAVRSSSVNKFAKYREDPCAYARDVLGVTWWSKQEEIARALITHQRVFVKASHSVGKTFLAGGLVNWHFDCFNPSITKTTAPSDRQVKDLTWKEVRLQRKGRDMLPKAPRIESYFADGEINMGHVAAGYTAKDSNSFQGDHEEALLLIFEEGCGIGEQFWTAGEGMLTSGELNRWLTIMNPTDTASHAYQEELTGEWHVITISALEHPNILAELRGEPRPFPKAISVPWIEAKLKKWCKPIEPSAVKPTDICWPPLEFCNEKGIEPQWYRPGPLFESRVLGRWPSQATVAVWSEALWLSALTPKLQLQLDAQHQVPEIGCDVARFGDDKTVMHVRRGGCSFHHESHSGLSTTETAGRLKQLCDEWGGKTGLDPHKVNVKVDDDGVGGGVVDQRGDYDFVGIGAGTSAVDPEHYPNRRSELWFATAKRADEGRLDLSLLDDESTRELRIQLMAPRHKPDSEGRRVVEPKIITKGRIKRSPDDADAFNLAYAPAPSIGVYF